MQPDSKVNSAPKNYFLDLPTPPLTADAYTTKIFLGFYIGDTVALETKLIDCRHSASSDLSNPHFRRPFLVPMTFFEALSHILA